MDFRASQMPRVTACPGSARLSERFPEPEEPGPAAAEGTAAHWVLEQVIKTGAPPPVPTAPNGHPINRDMVRFAEDFIQDLKNRFSGLRLISERSSVLNLKNGHRITGTCDLAFQDGPGRTAVIDYKYGRGVVSEKENTQLTAYALMFAHDYGFSEQYLLGIYQPRARHELGPRRSECVSKQVLLGREATLQQAVDDAASEDPPLRTSKHCRYCPAAVFCPARQKEMDTIFDYAQGYQEPEGMPAENMAAYLDVIEESVRRMEGFKRLLEERIENALKEGQRVPGLALKPRYGTTEWTCDPATLKTLGDASNVSLVDEKPVTPAEARRRGLDDAVVEGFTTRPLRGNKIARVDQQKIAEKVFNNG